MVAEPDEQGCLERFFELLMAASLLLMVAFSLLL
jgi:hypothetical protein